jgi:fatty acid desaturase
MASNPVSDPVETYSSGADAFSAPSPVRWYRTPLRKEDFKRLHERSDWQGWMQTIFHLGLLALLGSLALYSAGHGPVWLTLLLFFCYGMVGNFLINGVHELGHGTVFRTKTLNVFFVRVFSFLYVFNFEMFNASHARHHRYTLHAPDDLEVVLPQKVIIRQFFQQGFINPKIMYSTVKNIFRIARGRFEGEWELTLYPPGSPERDAPVNWARTLLVGHGLIIALSLYFHLWLLPVLTSMIPLYGAWLFFLCNNTQHIGLQDDVEDFRLCCRTFTLNPFVEMLYWHMNYHTEHHMYAAVPCYKLAELHRLIRYDLPPCPHGLIATWREIAAIQRIQKDNPSYQHIAPLPASKASPA